MFFLLLVLTSIVEAIGREGIGQAARLLVEWGLGFDIDTISPEGLRILANVFLEGLFVTAILLLWLLLSYNGAAWLHRKLRLRPRVQVHPPEPPTLGKGHKFDKFEKIGIILAGGGAKGAYRAGVLKAIHEFLEENKSRNAISCLFFH